MKNAHYLAAISAYTLWGMFSLALRPLQNYLPLDILFNRIVLSAFLILLILVVLKRQAWSETLTYLRALESNQRTTLILWNIFMGLLLTANWYLFIYVMNEVSVRATSLSYLVCPIITAVLATIFLKDVLKKIQWMGIGLGIAGCLVLSVGHFFDLLLSMLVASSYACYLILQRKNSGLDSIVVLGFHFLIAIVFLTPMCGSALLATHGSEFYLFIGIIAIFLTVVPLWLNLFALKGLTTSTTGMLINVNPIIAFSLAILYFKETTSTIEILGYSMVFLSVVVFNLPALMPKFRT